jgi:hypothetical protein
VVVLREEDGGGDTADDGARAPASADRVWASAEPERLNQAAPTDGGAEKPRP